MLVHPKILEKMNERRKPAPKYPEGKNRVDIAKWLWEMTKKVSQWITMRTGVRSSKE